MLLLNIGLAKKFVRKSLQKNPNELFGQPNIIGLKALKRQLSPEAEEKIWGNALSYNYSSSRNKNRMLLAET